MAGDEFWELESLPEMSPTPLYSMSPIGLGTGDVESLTSYITRLAHAHRVPVGILISGAVAPLLLGEEHIRGARPHTIFNRVHCYMSGAIDSNGEIAERWSSALGRLTGHGERLRVLTMRPFASVFASRTLCRGQLAWCPCCYDDWRSQSKPLYNPLLWSLEVVTVCAKHQVRLWTCCPFCSHSRHPITYKAILGYCSRCFRFLGASLDTLRRKAPIPDETQWQNWVDVQMRSVLAAAPAVVDPAFAVLMGAIRELVERFSNGNVRAFARTCGINVGTISGWKHARGKPTLIRLLELSHALSVPLPTLMAAQTAPEKATVSPEIGRIFSPGVAMQRAINREELISYLQRIIASSEEPPPSFKDVCERYGHSPYTVRQLFPELALAVSTRYKQRRTHEKLQRLEQLRLRLKEVIAQLVTEGVYPTRSRIAERLNHPGNYRTAARDGLLVGVRQEVLDRERAQISKNFD